MTTMPPSRRSIPALIAIALACLAPLWTTPRAGGVPEPNPVPLRWEFDFRPDALRLVNLEVEGEGPVWFCFLTYRVSNHSGQDRMLAPLFELATDEGHVVRSGRDVPPEITAKILAMLDDPLLQDQLGIVSTLLQGIENSRRGVVIWRLPGTRIDEITVFAAGFSGESESFIAPDPETGEAVRHVLRKTRMLRYALPGEITGRSSPTPELVEARWILR
jgi:hypothetical protein